MARSTAVLPTITRARDAGAVAEAQARVNYPTSLTAKEARSASKQGKSATHGTV